MSVRKGGQVIAGTPNITGVLSDVADLKQTTLRTDQITNCITEIPQDIKLELNNGTLTLKAGSKVYVPNGAGVFDEVVINEDKTVLTFNYTGTGFVFIRQDGRDVYCNQDVSLSGSGTSPSTGMYYKTDINEINLYNSGTVQDGRFSFPIAICTVSNGAISSIDQVFNGFGYIGSTVFRLPNVKGLQPNGRNEDGTLKSIERTWSSVTTQTIDPAWGNQHMNLILWGSSIEATQAIRISQNKEVYNQNTYSYVEDENMWYYTSDSGATWIKITPNIGGTLEFTGGKITSLTPKLPFHAVDRNDSSWLQAKFDAKADVSVVNGKANTSLSNLDATGQAKFDAKADVSLVNGKANTSLSNLDATGQAKFNAKADVSLVNGKANTSLSNLDATGQAKFNAKADVSLVNGKANTNASNFTATGKANIVGWGMPDYSSSVAISMPYTAPSNGWFVASTVNNTAKVYINGIQVAQGDWYPSAWSGNLNCQIMVSRGDTITGATGVMYFIPCKGVN